MEFSKINEYETIFVKHIPEDIESGILYISEEYGSMVHLCACGCGTKAAISFKPFWENGWDYERDGNVVSFHPCLLHRFKCKSHYYLKKNRVEWIED